MFISCTVGDAGGSMVLHLQASDAQVAALTGSSETTTKTSVATFFTAISGDTVTAADVDLKVLTNDEMAEVWGLNEE